MKHGASGGKWLLLLVPIVLLLLALHGLLLRPLAALHSTDCLVRVSYTELENLFHVPYEYYALQHAGKGTVRIPAFLVELTMGSAAEEKTIYDDPLTEYWFVTLQYGKDELTAERTHMETSFGQDYWILWDRWTRRTGEPAPEDLARMQRTAEQLHDGNLEHWSWKGGGAVGLTSFMMIRHGDMCLVKQGEHTLYRVEQDGSLTPVMECPENGNLDCWFFQRIVHTAES